MCVCARSALQIRRPHRGEFGVRLQDGPDAIGQQRHELLRNAASHEEVRERPPYSAAATRCPTSLDAFLISSACSSHLQLDHQVLLDGPSHGLRANPCACEARRAIAASYEAASTGPRSRHLEADRSAQPARGGLTAIGMAPAACLQPVRAQREALHCTCLSFAGLQLM